MGNTESVESGTDRSVAGSKQHTIEKLPEFVSADELGILTQNDSGKLPRSPKEKERCEEGSEDLKCSTKPGIRPEHQITSQHITTQDVVNRQDREEEYQDRNVRLLQADEPQSSNPPMESTDVLKARPDEAVDGGGSLNALRDGEFSTTHKQELGDQLYESITKWYPGQAEMLVGMLLELDHKHLEILIQDEVLLKHRVQEAVRALESYQGGSFEENGVCNVGDKESLGDKIYKVVVDLYPDRAEQITGMLLEMDVEDLLVLVERNDLLSGKAQQAYEALGGVTEQKSTHSSDFGEIGEKLYKLVEDVYPSCADKLTGMLLEMDRQCLQNLMKNPTSLEERMAEAFLVLGNADGNTDAAFEEHEKRLTIGEQLYAIVENFQPENADKVTGMLLEMPANELSVLMDNQSLLEQKVTQSLKALTEDSGLARSNEKEYLGEQLYEIISKDLPEHAERITGMLLEMDLGCIEELLQNPDILDDKVQAALKVVLHEAS